MFVCLFPSVSFLFLLNAFNPLEIERCGPAVYYERGFFG